jgi:hypothetical protein
LLGLDVVVLSRFELFLQNDFESILCCFFELSTAVIPVDGADNI